MNIEQEAYCLEDALARLSDRQRQKIKELIDERAMLIVALQKIEQCLGPFSPDPSRQVSNQNRAMKNIAKDALSKI